VTVAGLTLPLLLTLHAWQDWQGLDSPGQHAAPERLFRALAALLLALLFVIMASALARMNLYRSEYGLTELRVYTTAFMGWLAVVFAWFGATVLYQHGLLRYGPAAKGFGLPPAGFAPAAGGGRQGRAGDDP